MNAHQTTLGNRRSPMAIKIQAVSSTAAIERMRSPETLSPVAALSVQAVMGSSVWQAMIVVPPFVEGPSVGGNFVGKGSQNSSANGCKLEFARRE